MTTGDSRQPKRLKNAQIDPASIAVPDSDGDADFETGADFDVEAWMLSFSSEMKAAIVQDRRDCATSIKAKRQRTSMTTTDVPPSIRCSQPV